MGKVTIKQRKEIRDKSDLLTRAKAEYGAVDDMKLRMSLVLMADHLNDYARKIIYATYTDTQILLWYKKMRDDKVFETGGKSKVRRELVRFPNGFVYDFCKAVLEPMYGYGWEINRHAMQHEIMRPWLLVKKF